MNRPTVCFPMDEHVHDAIRQCGNTVKTTIKARHAIVRFCVADVTTSAATLQHGALQRRNTSVNAAVVRPAPTDSLRANRDER